MYEIKISHHILQAQKKRAVSFKNVDIIWTISQNNKKTAHKIANTNIIHLLEFIVRYITLFLNCNKNIEIFLNFLYFFSHKKEAIMLLFVILRLL